MEKSSSYFVAIPTYKRPQHCLNLLEQLRKQIGVRDVLIHVYNDCSPLGSYDKVRDFCNSDHHAYSYYRFQKNKGKQLYWQIISRVLTDARFAQKDFFLLLNDDGQILCGNIFAELDRLWLKITNPEKGALVFLRDSRNGKAQWTGIPPSKKDFNGEEFLEQGWVDSYYMMPTQHGKLLRWEIPEVDRDTWKSRPHLGSQVGRHVSLTLATHRKTIYASPRSLIKLLPLPSVMNTGRNTGNLREIVSTLHYGEDKMENNVEIINEPRRIYANLATYPQRSSEVASVVSALSPQVARINVYLNGYSSMPLWARGLKNLNCILPGSAGGEQGDSGKFWLACKEPGYHLICDDDIAYPENYAQEMVKLCDKYERRAVIGLHGVNIEAPAGEKSIESYYKNRAVYHFSEARPTDLAVDLVATGTAVLHSDTMQLSPKDFPSPNIADIWFLIACQKQQIPTICAGVTKSRWIHQINNRTSEQSLYQKFRNGNDPLHTKLVNLILPLNSRQSTEKLIKSKTQSSYAHAII